ncbi:MAG: hypothetical protein IJJ64_06300 [Butyrivibrio sp.]|nr:hypothetical protein [Butyrivibrio sp.]
MNAENVIPYGKFAHEVAQQGGVDAYKAAQKALLNTVKEKSFQDGVSAGQKGLIPWLVGTGLVAVGFAGYEGYKFVKGKIVKKKEAKAQLAKDAEEAEKILTDMPMHEDIIKEIEDDIKED